MSEITWTYVPDEAAEYAERQKARHEQAERDQLAARAQESADQAEHKSWLSRLRGQAPPTVSEILARAQQDNTEPTDFKRRRMAREILARHGLEDQLPGGPMAIFDANLGELPTGRESVSRAARTELDDPEVRRSLEKAREANAYVARVAARRQTEIARQKYQAACRETNVAPGEGPARRSAASQDAEIQRLLNRGFSLAAAQAATL